MTTRAERLDPVVRQRLVCPQDHGELIDAGDELYNPRLHLAYAIDEAGIPNMLISAAREVGVVLPMGAVVAQLMASARANGDGGLDHSGLLRGVERLSGLDTAPADSASDEKGGA